VCDFVRVSVHIWDIGKYCRAKSDIWGVGQERISKTRNPSDNPQTPHADKSASGFATPSGMENSLVRVKGKCGNA
jgi:hypothetical protein